MNDLIPEDFSGCAEEELGKSLYSYSKNSLFDEFGDNKYGWFGLIVYQKRTYIIWITRHRKFGYKAFHSQHAAKKSWDHLCNKYEVWYTERHGKD
jgi:hypothetical protein